MVQEWWTLEEFAKLARVTVATAQRYAREGRIAVRKIGKRYLIAQGDVTAFMEGLPAVPAPPPARANKPTVKKKGR